MRTQLQRLSIVSLVAVGTVFMAEPDLAFARGCGGGNGGGEGHHADPQGGEGHHGPRNRGQRGRNGPNGGYRNGPHGRGPHGRPGRSGYPRVHRGPNVDVTVGGYGYPGGRIGPQTPACYELARMRNDLSALWNLRAQINSGKRLIVVDDGGQQRVISTRGHSRGATGHAVGADR
jgi:hypothetical protein